MPSAVEHFSISSDCAMFVRSLNEATGTGGKWKKLSKSLCVFESVDIFIFRSKRPWCNENRWIDAPANAHQLLLLLLSSQHKLEQPKRKKSGKIGKWSDTLTCGWPIFFCCTQTSDTSLSIKLECQSHLLLAPPPQLTANIARCNACVCLRLLLKSERGSLLSTIKTIFFVQTNAIKVIANFECTWNHVLNPIPDKTQQQKKKEFEVGVLWVFCSHRRHAR